MADRKIEIVLHNPANGSGGGVLSSSGGSVGVGSGGSSDEKGARAFQKPHGKFFTPAESVDGKVTFEMYPLPYHPIA